MDNENALIKIKILISRYYERLGRDREENQLDTDILVEDIEEIVNKVRLPNKKLIVERLEMDKKNEE